MSDDDPKFDAVQRRLEEADLEPDDREFLDEVNAELRRDSVGDSRHRQVIDNCLNVARARAEHGITLPSLLDDEDAVDELRDWISELTYEEDGEVKPLTERSQWHYRSSIRKAAAVLGPDEENREVPFPTSKFDGTCNVRPSETAPPWNEVLFWNTDIVPLIEQGCKNARDSAIGATAWDSAGRPWELRDLTYGQISEVGDWLQLTLGGKETPLRDVVLFAATPYLRYWLDVGHPLNETDGEFTRDTPIWTQLERVEKLHSSTFTRKMPEAADRVEGLTKPMNLRRFRKSRASVLATRVADKDAQYDQWDLERHMGWEHGSEVAGIYIARFDELANMKRGRVDGVPEQYLPDSSHSAIEEPAPVKCPNCERWTPRHCDDCLWCQTGVVLDEVEEADLEVLTETEADYRERRDEFMADVARDNVDPDKLDVAIRFGDFLSENDEAADAAQRLRDALDDDSTS